MRTHTLRVGLHPSRDADHHLAFLLELLLPLLPPLSLPLISVELPLVYVPLPLQLLLLPGRLLSPAVFFLLGNLIGRERRERPRSQAPVALDYVALILVAALGAHPWLPARGTPPPILVSKIEFVDHRQVVDIRRVVFGVDGQVVVLVQGTDDVRHVRVLQRRVGLARVELAKEDLRAHDAQRASQPQEDLHLADHATHARLRPVIADARRRPRRPHRGAVAVHHQAPARPSLQVDPREVRQQAHRFVDDFRQQQQVGHRGDDQEHAQVCRAEHDHHFAELLDDEDGGDQRRQQHHNQDDGVRGQLLGADVTDRQRREVQQAHQGDSHSRHDARGEERRARLPYEVRHQHADHCGHHADDRRHRGVLAQLGYAHETLVQQLVLLHDVAYDESHGRAGDQSEHFRVAPAVHERHSAERHCGGVRDLRVDQMLGQLALVHKVQRAQQGLQPASCVTTIAGYVRRPPQGVFR
mmetsp:Transcript_76051/g.199479  ORF Transcript_76051/g.199479 Transcript_76051/m.199479 type:complete len:469 (-) Transcript_76051:106-1512(-)